MALHLITGYAGREHITSQDQGAYNIATFGGGNMVLDRGEKFKHTVLTNNSISIADGEAMLQGRYIKMPFGTTETVTIENGSQGKYRNDLICIRYEKSTVDSTESTSLVVIKGTETTGTPTDPAHNNGNITDGDANIADFPLYRVKLNGINIESVTPLFNVVVSMADYMKNYQLPMATGGQLGGVKVGSGITLSSDGKISVPVPTKLGNSTIGSEVIPMFLNNGEPKQGKRIKRDMIEVPCSISVSANTYNYISISNNAIVDALNRKNYGIYNTDYILGISGARGYDGVASTSVRFALIPLGKGESGNWDFIVINAVNNSTTFTAIYVDVMFYSY